jgi:hypothetical protein
MPLAHALARACRHWSVSLEVLFFLAKDALTEKEAEDGERGRARQKETETEKESASTSAQAGM